jgi:tRNA nucleotidyltransferase (CCA-adding enzyme)
MCDMVASGAMRELAPERFGSETLKAMSTLQPWRYFEVLHRCGALQDLLPLVEARMGEVTPHEADDEGPAMSALRRSVSITDDPERRLVAALWPCVNGPVDIDSAVGALRLRRQAAQLLRRSRAVAQHCEAARHLDQPAIVELAVQWYNVDAVQRTGLIHVCAAQSGDPRLTNLLLAATRAAAEIDARTLSDSGLAGPELGEALDRRRRQSAAQALAAAAR